MRRVPRDRRTRLGVCACLAACAALVTDRGAGFSWFQYGGADVVWFGGQSLRYLSPSTFPPGSLPELHLLSAMGLWNLVPACDFEYFAETLDQDYPVDHFDGYSDTLAVPASSLDPGVLGVTYLVNSGAEWYDMDLVFSDYPGGVGWTFDPNPDCATISQPAPSNGYSFLLVAAHELGHALGLGHDPQGNEPAGTPWFIATMNPRYPSGGPNGQENIIELHTDDQNGARYLYPHTGPSDPPLVDLASPGYTSGSIVGKAVPLFFSPLAAGPGQEITLRSVIENLGTTSEFFVRQGFYLSADATIDSGDTLLGTLLWDLAFQNALQFDVSTDLPADLPAGTWFLGAIFDDLDEIAEQYEDNNAVAYCQPLTVTRLAPAINVLGQHAVACGQAYTGPTPAVTHPLNMAPISWSLDNPQPGMTINASTGVVSWPNPVRSPFLYTIYVRATNSSGSDTEVLFLGVDSSPPQIMPIADHVAACGAAYTGPTPAMTQPNCMTPIINWSLDAAPPGMSINHSTGVVSWSSPRPSLTAHTVTIRATNSVGNGTETWLLEVPAGDMNGSGQAALDDLAAFESCLSGPGVIAPANCGCADADGDNDVDLRDFRALQAAM